MDKTLLKRAALESIILMIIVLLVSYTLHKQEQKLENPKDDFNTSSENPAGMLDNSTDIDINQFSTGKQELNDGVHISEEILADQYLIIKKLEGSSISYQLEDIFISKSIKITILNLERDNILSSMIGRVNKEEVFYGDPLVISKEEEEVTLDYGNDVVHSMSIHTEYVELTKTYSAEITIELDQVYDVLPIEDENYYYINLRKPKEVYDNIIVIDAGHGGKDSGAIATDGILYEKNINLNVLLELKKLLEEDNIKVYYTRTKDEQVYLKPRVELANDVDADFFISIHSNASVSSEPSGTEVYYYDTQFNNVNAKELATLFLESVTKEILLQKRYIVERKGDQIYILEKATVPSVLIELGYVTNINDVMYLRNDKNYKIIAQGIYNAIHLAYQTFYSTEIAKVRE